MNDLVLGWALDGSMAPSYWVSGEAKAGKQSAEDLVLVDPKSLGCHSVVVAQSGSGKSFFLGRLIEEIALKTRGRVVVLDPNGDFRRIRDVVAETSWTTAAYLPKSGRGRLPHEASRAEFEPHWKALNIDVRCGPYAAPKGSRPVRVAWSTFPIAFLAENLDAIARSQLYHCHEFVKSITSLETSKLMRPTGAPGPLSPLQPSRVDYLERSRRLLQRARHEGARQTIEDEFPLHRSSAVAEKLSPLRWRKTAFALARERAVSAVEFISSEIERFYFGRAKEYAAEGIVSHELLNDSASNFKIRVFDLPSFRDLRTQQVVLSSVMETLWNEARQEWALAFENEPEKDERVPVFIVLEEAHNIVPSEAHTDSAKALREQVRSIAAEGRKYGVFLILCTQRPDKLDPAVISECENRALMKLGAKTVLDRTREQLGLEGYPEHKLQKCLEFQAGRFLLAGPWAGDDPKFGYCAMRRTVEGGRSLRPQHWATSEPLKLAASDPA